MDRTLVNIASILIGGAGLFAVLTGFSAPQLNMSFFGENPFAIKRDIIDTTLKWVFAFVALGGLFLQLWAEIWGGSLPDRSHEPKFYINVGVGGLVAVTLLIWALTGVGTWAAKLQWLPKVVEISREGFERSIFAIEHDGLHKEHWENREQLARTGDVERLKSDGLRNVEQTLSQIEALLEERSVGNLKERAASLGPYFSR